MLIRPLAIFAFSLQFAFAAEGVSVAPSPANASTKSAKDARQVSPAMKAAIEKLKLPGVKINLDAWCVDVESEVCLREGLLELIACTKDSKEHESIIMVTAKPSHIHTALLLLGARAGNPAQRRLIEGENARFIDLPARGEGVDVFLVLKGPDGKETPHSISDFVVRAERDFGNEGGNPGKNEEEPFPAQPFIFAGSVLVGEGDGPRQYLSDQSGNVISITTFGDELLSLAGYHEASNESLVWQVAGDKLPEVGTKVILRIAPRAEAAKAPAANDQSPKLKPEAAPEKAAGN